MTVDAQLATWLADGDRSNTAIPSTSPAWDRFARTVCRSGLAGLILEAALRKGIDLPDGISATLRDRATVVAAHNLNQMHELERLLAAFERAGVPVLPLKGAALHLTVYDRPDLRPMSDLDLLIKPESTERTFRLLRECGYRRGFELVRDDFFPKYHYEVEFLGPPPSCTRIDLHARPLRPLRLARTLPDDALWQGAFKARCGRAEALLPRPDRMFIHLAAHAAYHGCSRLLWLYDLKRLADHCGDTMDWSMVVRSAHDWRLSLPVLRAVERAEAFLGPIVPPAVSQDLRDRPSNWRDRMTLAQTPQDAASPAAHVLVNLLCTPGVRFKTGYLWAHLMPGNKHLGGLYPYRHRGWTACAHVWRIGRAVRRMVIEPLIGLGRRVVRRVARGKPPVLDAGRSVPEGG